MAGAAAGRKESCATLEEFDVLEWLMSGKPVPLVIEGVEFGLRQPTPLEVDRMQYQQTRAYDRALADYRADGLGNAPVTDGMAETIRIYNEMQDAAYRQAQADGDTEATIRIAREQEQMARQWPRTLAEERARDHARKTTARWCVDNLLDGDKAIWRELTAPDPLERREVMQAVQRLLALANHDPNSNRRKA